MIKYTPASQLSLQLFKTPFDQALSAENRWVKMAALVPWDEMATVFLRSMSANEGRPSVDLRIVLGTLLVKHIEDLSDERTIEYVQENIYAQYFVGLTSFQTEPVFVPHLFVTIRKRLGEEGTRAVNDMVIAQARKLNAIRHRARPSDGVPTANAVEPTRLRKRLTKRKIKWQRKPATVVQSSRRQSATGVRLLSMLPWRP